MRASWRGQWTACDLAVEGYNKYSKNGKPFAFPDILFGPEIMIPMSEVSAMVAHPDSVLSPTEYHCDLMQTDYTFHSREAARDPLHIGTIQRYLTRQLPVLVPDIMDEVKRGYDEFWGLDTEEWKEIAVQPTLEKIVTRVSNRIIVGPTLCRNKDYLKSAADRAHITIICVLVLHVIPEFLKPVLGPIITLPSHYHFRKWGNHVFPLLKQRIVNTRRKLEDPTYKYEPPRDFLQWHVQHTIEHPDPRERTLDVIASRVETINFASIHTTMTSVTNAVFDLYSTPSEKGYVGAIREEVTRVLKEEGGAWTKAGLGRMYRLESALKESLRWRGGGSRSVSSCARKVVAREGVTLAGMHIPYGCVVGAPAWTIQRDPAIYSAGTEFDPFRFSRPREQLEASGREAGEGDPDGDARGARFSMTTTKDDFLVWGHGRHACPGRFFGSCMLKLLLAYSILNYDVEHLPAAPAYIWMGDTAFPPPKATLRIRRRKGTV
ncbi:MAG: hypothetical protein M1813_004037 [Trichoglossum hirsutum]|nr:MAG: hypothetical protein M1813_004037 [Trichoglossum hirsutum]